jgi:hypothetical protein
MACAQPQRACIGVDGHDLKHIWCLSAAATSIAWAVLVLRPNVPCACRSECHQRR